jgi:hypothetical protein
MPGSRLLTAQKSPRPRLRRQLLDQSRHLEGFSIQEIPENWSLWSSIQVLTRNQLSSGRHRGVRAAPSALLLEERVDFRLFVLMEAAVGSYVRASDDGPTYFIAYRGHALGTFAVLGHKPKKLR